MGLQKPAAWAQILSLPFGMYCAWGTYVSLNPGVEHPPIIGSPVLLWIGFAALGTSLLILFLASIGSRSHRWFSSMPLAPATVAPKPSRLTIHSAVYGVESYRDSDVTSIVRDVSADGIVVPIDNNSMGGDPAPGQLKRLTVRYSYGGMHNLIATRPEGAILVLPEDDWIRRELARLNQTIEQRTKERDAELDQGAALRSDLRACEDKLSKTADQLQRLVNPVDDPSGGLIRSARVYDLTSKAPQVLLQHKGADVFIFVNEGPGAVQRIAMDSLLVRKTETSNPSNTLNRALPLSLHNVVGIVRPGDSIDARFGVADGLHSQPLIGFMRDYLQVGWDTEFSTLISYEDMNGNRFARRFVLSIDPYNRIASEADPVQLPS